jgi:lipid-A-disaccharide synthase
VADKIPTAEFHVARSGLIDDATWTVALSGIKTHDFGGVALKLEGNYAVTPNGTRLEIHHENKRYELMKRCAVAITSPGTNTLELGIAGIPSIICMPLQKMELVPIENPLRYLELLPLIGKPIKRALVLAFLNRFKFVALPNMLADELIQPELRGNITVQNVADAANLLLSSPSERQRITSRLEQTMPKAGTAKMLAKQMLERVKQ